MSHTCHWPDCKAEVPPAMWGCKFHWFKLPRDLRARIWATYRVGQEITKTPSPAYLAAAKSVQLWIEAYENDKKAKMLKAEEVVAAAKALPGREKRKPARITEPFFFIKKP